MGIFPFNDLSLFDQIRSLALQDPTLALARAKLLSTPASRSIVQIYYGPPGTGKTLAAVRRAVEIADPAFEEPEDFRSYFIRFNELIGQVAFLTFHQSLQYSDVAEAIRPSLSEYAPVEPDEGESSDDEDGAAPTDLAYRRYYGPIMRMIRRATANSDEEHVLVIDEINRGDISRILGPMISALEADKRLGGEFPIGFEALYPESHDDSRIFIPANLHVIGTMNTADRNIALVDHALRRRFEFVETPPRDDLLPGAGGDLTIDVRSLLLAVNRRIRFLLDRDHCIGHGYLMGCAADTEVVERFARRILPLLGEYFYGAEASLLLVVGDRPGGAYNIHLVEKPDENFAAVFGINVDSALDLGYRAGQARLGVCVDPRFWNPDLRVPGPGDLSYAISALKKIYTGDARDAAGDMSEPPESLPET
jgi:5-methylcytosine-specific restriction protein B